MADAFLDPARTVAIRAVVPVPHLPTAFAQEEARGYAAELAGNPVGGILFQVGWAFPFLFDALTYLVSLTCVLAAKVPRRPPCEDEQSSEAVSGPATKPSMKAHLAEALRWLWGQHGLRAALAFSLVANLVASAIMIPVIVLVVGFLGVALAAMTLPLGPWWPAVPLILGFLAVPALNVVLNVLLATLVPQHMLGRMGSLLKTASMALAPISQFHNELAELLIIVGCPA